MPQYTVKTFAPQGRLIGRFAFAAANEHEAELVVQALLDGRPRELWSAGRCVRSWAARVRAA